MIAITTKYIGATTHRGGRVKATAGKVGSATLLWDHALSVTANHDYAAKTLATKLKWSGWWSRAESADGRGNVYVLTTQDFGFTVEPKTHPTKPKATFYQEFEPGDGPHGY